MSNKKVKTFTVDDLISKANEALNKLQPDLACKFYQKALEMEPQNTNLMDALADVSIQIGQSNEALTLLKQSTLLAPNENPYKWMFLAQLQSGIDAIESYNRGISLLSVLTSDPEINDAEEKLEFYKKQISKAYCSIAELYLTDLCYEEGAENKCEEAIAKALEVTASSLDAQQAMASLRFSQNRSIEACNIMEIVFRKVKESIDKVNARTVIEEINPDTEDDEDVPEPEFCIATSKLLIECAAVNSKFADYAMTLISDLLQHDDENVELWYMMGVAALGSNPVDIEAAKIHLEHAKTMMDNIREEVKQFGEQFPYDEQYILVMDHLQILEQHIKDNPDLLIEKDDEENIEDEIMIEESNNDEDNEDEEWSDYDEEDIE